MESRQYIRISELLLYCSDGSATREDIAELEALLDQNRQALEYYVEISRELNYFHCLAQIPLTHPESVQGLDVEFRSDLDPHQQLDLLWDHAEYEKHAVAVDIVKPVEDPQHQLIKDIQYERPTRSINRFSLVTAALCVAALLVMVAYLHFAPPAAYEVATISDSLDAKWSSDLPTGKGTRISSNSDPVQLTRGIVKLRTDDQVDIVLEAPCEFYFSSYSEVSMNYGKLFARVSEMGYGFSVVTPNSKVVDLGTEFGILGHIDGNTEVHMYTGKANIFAGEKHQRKTSEILTAGAAVKVDSQRPGIQTIALDEQALVREFDSQTKFIWKGQKAIRLTDLLLGGNGFGTASKQNIEYDPLTGEAVSVGQAGYRNGTGKLVRIPQSPYLDGIFVPNGQDFIISSAGHRFHECPPTSNQYYSNIICGKNCSFFGDTQDLFMQSCRHPDDFGFLYLHSNMGLTIDLNAIRRKVPGLQVTAFSTFAGIVDLWNNEPDYSEADVWILVDGQIKYCHKALRADQGCNIQIDLLEKDRFLTLAVTDGGKINSEGNPPNHYDTCGFAEPSFELTLSTSQ